MTIEPIDYRFELIRDGVKVGELISEGDVQIRMETSGKVKTDLSGTFRMDGELHLLTDRIRPLYGRGGVWTPLGLYVINEQSAAFVDGNGLVNLSAMDLGYLVQRRSVEDRPFFPAGELYTEVVQRLLSQCGITAMRAQTSELRLRNDREDWEIGTSVLDIVNDLLAEINYDDLWFDPDGYARLGQSDRGNLAAHVYRADEASIITPEYTQDFDLRGAYNVFKAYVSSPDGTMMTAVAENDNPSSSIAISRIGRNALLERLNDIASQEELEQYVLRKRNESMSALENVSFTTAVRSHGVGDLVFLQHHEMRGLYRETSWEITLGGEMTHTAQKVVVQV